MCGEVNDSSVEENTHVAKKSAVKILESQVEFNSAGQSGGNILKIKLV